MNGIIHFDPADILPSEQLVLQRQGVPADRSVSEKVKIVLTRALIQFQAIAQPVALAKPVSVGEFATIFAGEGKNDSPTPLAQTFPQTEQLTLFAVTLGASISEAIENLFDTKNFPLGLMLDSIASVAADSVVDLMAKSVSSNGHFTLGYSPGYCGWHISGQQKLFEFLEPEKIGIRLNPNFLMTPLKSVSGVLVTGPPQIHQFKPDYPFCQSCQTHECGTRQKSSINPAPGAIKNREKIRKRNHLSSRLGGFAYKKFCQKVARFQI